MISKQRLTQLLERIPPSWNGTTYPNDARFVGRQRFTEEMIKLLTGSGPIEEKYLDTMFPEDYLRVGSPLSNILEVVKSLEKGYCPAHVFSFGSNTFPLISVLFTAKKHVYVYGRRLFTETQEKMLKELYDCNFSYCFGEPRDHGENIVVHVADLDRPKVNPNVDAVVGTNGLLYIVNSNKVAPEDIKDSKGTIVQEGIHTMRKRFVAPPPTPDCIALLSGKDIQKAPDTTSFKNHLKQLGGVDDAKGDPVVTTAGLPAIGACIMSALELGNRDIDVVMCSTAYGGSSQQTDILTRKCGNLDKHTFDIQGATGNVYRALAGKLAEMKSGKTKSVTLIQLEYPTNPDMKDCDLDGLNESVEDFRRTTGSNAVLMFDTTFSPQCRPAVPFKNIPVIVFNSLSKSVSGGFTTGGSLVANHHEFAQRLLAGAHHHVNLLDSCSKGCQLATLAKMHSGCEERIKEAHGNCRKAAVFLENSVLTHSGTNMKVNFVTEAQIAKNVIPGTFSFNLPVPAKMSQQGAAGLAQEFVDRLVEQYPQGVKPCVSFGQKNSLVYATVPATSTQGVISEEDKAKQAVGGVQLVRFSFPPTMNMNSWNNSVDAALKTIYSRRSSM